MEYIMIKLTNEQETKVVELLEANKAPKARAYLVFEFDVSENEAREIVKLVASENDIALGGSRNDMTAMVETLRENHGKVERKELAKLMAEASGSTISTANHMISALSFAIEYHKQETI